MQKLFLLLALCGLSLTAHAESKTAVFAGGCFWCMQEPFDHVKGVTKTVVGYTGGEKKNANYTAVSAHKTQHREAIELEARSIATDDGHHQTVSVTDLGALPTGGGDGVVWSLRHGGDLDANLVRLGPDAAIGEHRNDEVDVLIYVQSGSGELVGDGHVQPLSGQHVALIPRGSRRSIRAGIRGLTYLSIHRGRIGLTVTQHPDVRSRSLAP